MEERPPDMEGKKVKVKVPRYKPKRLRGDLVDFRHYEGGKVITLTHRPPSPPGISWYPFLEAEDVGSCEYSE
jgi:hypothetical protein